MNLRLKWLTAARSGERALLLLALCALLGAPAEAETTIGLQALYVVGTHSEIDGSQTFNVPAALIQLRQRWHWLDVYVEGIPSTGSHSYLAPINGTAQPVTSLSVFDAVSHVRLDRNGRLWAGGGIAVINQITSVGSPPYSAASRLAGGRYELEGNLPVGRPSSVELRVAWVPSMHGTILAQLPYYYPNPVSVSEKAEATDFSGEYVLRNKRFSYGAGVRVINFVAHFVTPDILADRNSGAGVIFEVRYTPF